MLKYGKCGNMARYSDQYGIVLKIWQVRKYGKWKNGKLFTWHSSQNMASVRNMVSVEIWQVINMASDLTWHSSQNMASVEIWQVWK